MLGKALVGMNDSLGKHQQTYKGLLVIQNKGHFIECHGDPRVYFHLLCSFLYQEGAHDSWLSPSWNKHPEL